MARVLRSLDDGATFTAARALDDTEEVRAVHAGKNDDVWVLTARWKAVPTRLFESRDGGASFTLLGSPPGGSPVTAIGGSAAGELVVAAAGRVFEWEAGSRQFIELSVGAQSASWPLTALFAAAPHEILAVGSMGAILRVTAAPH
jgi:photosystem II stability/assembly factor-like uncharacterized protein